jgi:hypothetical protein
MQCARSWTRQCLRSLITVFIFVGWYFIPKHVIRALHAGLFIF